MHVNDVGQAIFVTIHDNGGFLDLSDATAITIEVQKPDETSATLEATFVGDGTDGELVYITQTGDIDQEGLWLLQVRVVGSATDLRTSLIDFYVGPAI